jgi:hypothetical protein
LIDTNDCVEAIIKFGSALDDDADKRVATVELLARAAPASLAEAIERMTNNGDAILVAHTIGTLALTVCALRGVPWQRQDAFRKALGRS